jgi:hypothetical protein
VPDANTILGVIPNRSGEQGVYHWCAPDRQLDEPWTDFVRRSADLARQAINGLRVEDEVRPDLATFVRYNLTYVSESEYARLGHQ